MIAWTVARANGDTRTFQEWGIKSAIDRRVSLGRGSVTLDFGRADLLGSLPFDRDETIVVLLDGAAHFRGRVIGEGRGAYGASESAVVTLADPWWYLEKLIFTRLSKFMADPNQNPVPTDPSGLLISDFNVVSKPYSTFIFGNNEIDALLDTRGMILEALNYAISKGAPIAIGTIDAGIQMPVGVARDMTCAEIILKAVNWTPDQTSWWDFSVDPPALNVRKRANRALLSLDVNDGAATRVELNPRYDLVLSGVTINYLRKHERPNFETSTLDTDQAGPDPLGFGALITTIELKGSFVSQGPTTADGTPPAQLIQEEDAPVGLAASIYNAFKDVSFDGSAAFVAGDPATLFLSKTLRVVNGAPAWAVAVMDIQETSLDLFALDDADGEYYKVDLTVGPPRRLGLTDLFALTKRGQLTPTPLAGGPGNAPDDGGSPKLPTWNYGNPKLPAANMHATVIGYHHFGQDVGFPNSYGGYADDEIIVVEIEGGLGFSTAPPAPGTILEFHGIRIGGANKYHQRSQPPPNGWGIRNDTYAGNPGNGPSIRVLAYTNPPTVT